MPHDLSSSFDSEIRKATLRLEKMDDESVVKEQEFFAEAKHDKERNFIKNLLDKLVLKKRERNNGNHEKTLYELLNEKIPSPFDEEVNDLREYRDELHGKAREIRREEIRNKISQLRERVRQQQERGIYLQRKFFSLLDSDSFGSESQFIREFQSDHLNSLELRILQSIYREFKSREQKAKTVFEKVRDTVKNKKKELFNDSIEGFSEDANREVAIELFRRAGGREPQGNVEIVLLKHAVCLKLYDDSDFLQFDSDIPGGLYIDIQTVNFPFAFVKNFPLVLVNASSNGSSVTHEQNHGIHTAIQEGIRLFQDSKLFWGGDDTQKTGYWRKSKRLYKKMLSLLNKYNQKEITNNSLQIELRKIILGILPEMISEGKDEIISDFDATKNFLHAKKVVSEKITNTQNDRAPNEENYGYLSDIGLDRNYFKRDEGLVTAYNTIIAEYNEIYEVNVKAMNDIWKLWRYFQTDHSKDELVAFMRQNPLNTWAVRANKLYGKEVKKLEKLKEEIDLIKKPLEEMKRELRQKKAEVQVLLQQIEDHGGQSRITNGQVIFTHLTSDADALLEEIDRILNPYQDEHELVYADKVASINIEEVSKKITVVRERFEHFIQEFKNVQKTIDTEVSNEIRNDPVFIFICKFKIDAEGDKKLRDSSIVIRELNNEFYRLIDQLDSRVVSNSARVKSVTSASSLFLDIESGKQIDEYIAHSNEALITFLEDEVLPIYNEKKAVETRVSSLRNELQDLYEKIFAKLKSQFPYKKDFFNANIVDRVYLQYLNDLLSEELSTDEQQKIVISHTTLRELTDMLERIRDMNEIVAQKITHFLSMQQID